LPVAFLVALPFTVRDAGPAWAAHLGHGRPAWIYVSALLALEGAAGIYLVISLLGEIRRHRISPRLVSPRP